MRADATTDPMTDPLALWRGIDDAVARQAAPPLPPPKPTAPAAPAPRPARIPEPV
jgi:hypothetical protein